MPAGPLEVDGLGVTFARLRVTIAVCTWNEGPASYVAIAVRTDHAKSQSYIRSRPLFESLPKHPIARRLRFVDPLSPRSVRLRTHRRGNGVGWSSGCLTNEYPTEPFFAGGLASYLQRFSEGLVATGSFSRDIRDRPSIGALRAQRGSGESRCICR